MELKECIIKTDVLEHSFLCNCITNISVVLGLSEVVNFLLWIHTHESKMCLEILTE